VKYSAGSGFYNINAYKIIINGTELNVTENDLKGGIVDSGTTL